MYSHGKNSNDIAATEWLKVRAP